MFLFLTLLPAIPVVYTKYHFETPNFPIWHASLGYAIVGEINRRNIDSNYVLTLTSTDPSYNMILIYMYL